MLSLAGFRVPWPRRHWTSRYFVDRVQLLVWEHRNPAAPWLVSDAVELLATWLRPGDVVVEFGSGRSTLWFAERVGAVISVDHDPTWAARVTGWLRAKNLSNVQHSCVTRSACSDNPGAHALAYVEAADVRLRGLADLVLVDGIHRDHCALWALEHVRAGGMIVVDNVNRYLPRSTRSPASLAANAEPPTPVWSAFAKTVAGWRQAWFSNGVTDTAVFFRA